VALETQNTEGYPATLFIPDISGFTQFIDQTEIAHSQRIIAELLELLIDANELDLRVSEIEGDAILFYRFGDAPSLEEVVRQTEKMFIAFHDRLQHYERDRICDCKACSTTRGLSLKIVVHYGNIATVDVKEHHKLLGREVIVAHRLLNNDIDSDEYVLITDNLIDHQEGPLSDLEAVFDWIECQSGTSAYNAIGDVSYKYFSLAPLCRKLHALPERAAPEKFKNKLSIQITIKAAIAFAYHVLTNISLRHHWMKRAKAITFDDQLPRIGSVHQCFLPGMALYIETKKNKFEEGKVEFVEKVTHMPMVPQANVFSTLEEMEEGTLQFTVDVYYQKSFLGKVMTPVLKLIMRNQFRGNALLFKRFVERSYEPGASKRDGIDACLVEI